MSTVTAWNRTETGCACSYIALVHDGERSRIKRVFRNRTDILDTSSNLELIFKDTNYRVHRSDYKRNPQSHTNISITRFSAHSINYLPY